MKYFVFVFFLLNLFFANFSIAQKIVNPGFYLCDTELESTKEISIKVIREIANAKCTFLKIIDTLGNEVEIRDFLFVHSKYYKNDSSNKIRKDQYLVDTIRNNKLSIIMKNRLRKAKVGDYLTIAEARCFIYGRERILNGLTIRIKE